MRVLIAGLAASAALALAAPSLVQTALSQTAAASVAPAGAYASDQNHTSVTWKALHQGLSWYTARFTKADIQLNFDPADPTKSTVRATIDPRSIETDYARTRPAGSSTDFNAELQGERFLNSAAHPQITFVSTRVVKTGANTGRVTGNLTFLGVTKPVTLDVTYNGNRRDARLGKHKVGFSLSGTIKLSDFGLTTAVLADEVRIVVESELVQK
jgi:polyisoprenoid-binding protein YceI